MLITLELNYQYFDNLFSQEDLVSVYAIHLLHICCISAAYLLHICCISAAYLLHICCISECAPKGHITAYWSERIWIDLNMPQKAYCWILIWIDQNVLLVYRIACDLIQNMNWFTIWTDSKSALIQDLNWFKIWIDSIFELIQLLKFKTCSIFEHMAA